MKDRMKKKRQQRYRRAQRVRSTVRGTADRPRLTVKRSLRHIYAQLINDEQGYTIVAADDLKQKERVKPKESAAAVGKKLAEKAIAVGISRAVVDRGPYTFHGRLKALVDAMEQAGIHFTREE